MDRQDKVDLAIAGGGVAGLMLAATLAQALGPDFRIALHDPALAARAGAENIRAYAISAFGCRQLQALGIWPDLAGLAQPIRSMVVTDSAGSDPVRPVFLRFEGEIGPDEPFAFMLSEAALLAALSDAARKVGVDLSSVPVATAIAGAAWQDIALADGGKVRTKLLVAADGRRSRLRDQAGIVQFGWDYQQNAIVVPVRHERDHGGRAEEHFLEAGPFAVLPMRAPDGSEHCSSIVWTETRARAEQICRLDPAAFDQALIEKFGLHLGAVRALAEPETYPLGFSIARRFFGPRLALLGDAAHVIHPLAGQGLNLGLKDAGALAELVIEAARLGLDIGAVDLLARYDSARRFDTTAMAVTTDLLNRLFSNDSAGLRTVRDIGLGMVERLPALKRFFIREAAGVASTPGRQRIAPS